MTAMPPSGRFLRLSLIAAVLFVAVYVVFAFTTFGEFLDDQAAIGKMMFHGHIHQVLGDVLNAINVTSIAVMIVLVSALGLLRRIPAVAFVVVGAFISASVLAEVFKRVLPRREGNNVDALFGVHDYNTFPSGHTTIAMSFVIALICVSSIRWRPAVAVAGCVWVSLIASGTLAAGWHRPSDIFGGVCLSLAVMGLAMGVLTRNRFTQARKPISEQALWIGAAGALVLVSVFLIVVLISPATAPAETRAVLWRFLTASLTIDAVSILGVCLFAWVSRDVVARPRHG